jgi:serine/threonine-protein kinase RIO1
MEYLGDDVRGAPALQTVALDPGEARVVFDRLVWNVELMLSKYVVHADLSAHNVLWWDGRAVIIDLPQAVTADDHPAAYSLLSRDVERLCGYFRKLGVTCDSQQIVHDLWARLLRLEL